MSTIRQSSDSGSPASVVLHPSETTSSPFSVTEGGWYGIVVSGLPSGRSLQIEAETSTGAFASIGNTGRVRTQDIVQVGSTGIYHGIRTVRLHRGRFRIVASASGATARIAGAGD